MSRKGISIPLARDSVCKARKLNVQRDWMGLSHLAVVRVQPALLSIDLTSEIFDNARSIISACHVEESHPIDRVSGVLIGQVNVL